MLDNFKFESGSDILASDALCAFIKGAITFGRIKGGETIPSISEILKATGLTFHQARKVIERLAREGYVRSRPHVGTVVRSRGKDVLRGRVLMALPTDDICRFYPTHLFDTIRRKLAAAGIRAPEDVKVLSISHKGFGPVYIKPLTRCESDPAEAGDKIADFALAVLEKGRIPQPPMIVPQYIYGATFPF